MLMVLSSSATYEAVFDKTATVFDGTVFFTSFNDIEPHTCLPSPLKNHLALKVGQSSATSQPTLTALH